MNRQRSKNNYVCELWTTMLQHNGHNNVFPKIIMTFFGLIKTPLSFGNNWPLQSRQQNSEPLFIHVTCIVYAVHQMILCTDTQTNGLKAITKHRLLIESRKWSVSHLTIHKGKPTIIHLIKSPESRINIHAHAERWAR